MTHREVNASISSQSSPKECPIAGHSRARNGQSPQRAVCVPVRSGLSEKECQYDQQDWEDQLGDQGTPKPDSVVETLHKDCIELLEP